jgi:hypothetical protein
MDRMADTPVYEYKVLHGRADKVEAQLNELAAAGWQFVALAGGSGGAGSLFFFALGAPVTILLRRERTPPG